MLYQTQLNLLLVCKYCGLHYHYARITLSLRNESVGLSVYSRPLHKSYRNINITGRHKLQNKEIMFSFVIYFPFSYQIKALMSHMYISVGSSLTVTKLIFLTKICFICIIYKYMKTSILINKKITIVYQ